MNDLVTGFFLGAAAAVLAYALYRDWTDDSVIRRIREEEAKERRRRRCFTGRKVRNSLRVK